MAEGWEGNRKYSGSIDPLRRTDPTVPDGSLDPDQFGDWLEFATCLKNVMNLVEGQAYFKETPMAVIRGRSGHVETAQKPVSESGEIMENDEILAGGVVGSSRYAAAKANQLFNMVKDDGDDNRLFHGAGLRYNEKSDGTDALVNKCEKFLPAYARNNPDLHPMAIEV